MGETQFHFPIIAPKAKTVFTKVVGSEANSTSQNPASLIPALIVKVHSQVCAVPLAHIIETMRPLPSNALAGTPSFVLGVSIIRGLPTPVVDLGLLLGSTPACPARFITVRLGGRQVAFAVDTVLGIHELDQSRIGELPPLLQGASQESIAAIGTLDQQTLAVLRAGWQLPGTVWPAVGLPESSQ